MDQTFFGSLAWNKKPKLSFYPKARYAHSCSLIDDSIFIFGGTTNTMIEKTLRNSTAQPLYEINCETYIGKALHCKQGNPRNRELHSCDSVNGCLVVVGGTSNNQCKSEGIKMIAKNQFYFWGNLMQFIEPKPRKSHSSTTLKKDLILVYGGKNDKEQILNDYWVYNTRNQLWFGVQPSFKHEKRVGCTLTTIKNDVYLFGGEKDHSKHTNQIFKITLTEQSDFMNIHDRQTLRIQLLNPFSQSPTGRSFHCGVCLFDKYLLILGGQCLSLRDGKEMLTLLNDIWMYDPPKNQWMEIKPTNNTIFKPRSHFSAINYQNKVIVFGGLIDIDHEVCSDQLLVLPIIPQSTPKHLYASLCQLIFSLQKMHYKTMDIIIRDQLICLESVGRSITEDTFQKIKENKKYKIRKIAEHDAKECLYVNCRGRYADMFLVNKFNQFYCLFDNETSTVRNVHSRTFEIINGFIQNNEIKLNGLESDSFSIIMVIQEPFVVYQNGLYYRIQGKMTELKEYILSNYPNKETYLKIKINQDPLNFY